MLNEVAMPLEISRSRASEKMSRAFCRGDILTLGNAFASPMAE
jgi:hypothetical protein